MYISFQVSCLQKGFFNYAIPEGSLTNTYSKRERKITKLLYCLLMKYDVKCEYMYLHDILRAYNC